MDWLLHLPIQDSTNIETNIEHWEAKRETSFLQQKPHYLMLFQNWGKSGLKIYSPNAKAKIFWTHLTK